MGIPTYRELVYAAFVMLYEHAREDRVPIPRTCQLLMVEALEALKEERVGRAVYLARHLPTEYVASAPVSPHPPTS